MNLRKFYIERTKNVEYPYASRIKKHKDVISDDDGIVFSIIFQCDNPILFYDIMMHCLERIFGKRDFEQFSLKENCDEKKLEEEILMVISIFRTSNFIKDISSSSNV